MMNMMKIFYPYHLVTISPWPLMSSMSLMILMVGVLMYMYEFSKILLLIGLIMILIIIFQWWRDIVRESTYQGMHCYKVNLSLRVGMFLFILSELMFFISFFWTYFHMYLSPSIEIGNYWPSFNLMIFNPYNIPLLNTLLLLSSGFSITWCHYSIMNKNYINSVFSIMMTILLGILFSMFQYMEYNESFFSISDSIYGSIFYMATGFHGLHVLIGSLFILVSMKRLLENHFSNIHHFGFEAASWYWHFVDVIWLFLYLFIYWMSY
uniref:Cytochrome c oxidase subunit 3 n=1 Tax=Eumacrocentrus sp. QL-2013 TaxID=1421594 RepID=A0A0A6ZLT7_9HYME|nr:cytochrome c oxidase subunit III [Eumacrocentrus sp. QL-2013]